MPDCLFCKIVSGQEQAVHLYKDDHCQVFMDLFPLSRGHILIIPTKHCVTWDELTPSVRNHLGKVSQFAAKATMQSSLGASGYNIQINNGKAANQHIPHLHIHVIPRYKGDTFSVIRRLLMQMPGLFIGKASQKQLTETRDIILSSFEPLARTI